jgi:hypothetical protein
MNISDMDARITDVERELLEARVKVRRSTLMPTRMSNVLESQVILKGLKLGSS